MSIDQGRGEQGQPGPTRQPGEEAGCISTVRLFGATDPGTLNPSEQRHLRNCPACAALRDRLDRARQRERLRQAGVYARTPVRLLSGEPRLAQTSPDGRVQVYLHRQGNAWVLRVISHDQALDRQPVRYHLADAHRQSACSGLLVLAEESPGLYAAQEYLNAQVLARQLGDVCGEVQVFPVDPAGDLRPVEEELYQAALRAEPKPAEIPEPSARLTGITGVRYKVLGRLGESREQGLHVARRGRQGNRFVLIKLLPAEEGQLPPRPLPLRHPNLAPTVDFCQDQGHRYCVTDHVEGPRRPPDWPGDLPNPPLTLPCRVREGCLNEPAALDLLSQLCDALAYLHAERVAHRQLRPENVWIGSAGRVVLMDFGLSRPMSPEQVPPETAVAEDLRGLGAVCFFALTGHPPGEASEHLPARLRPLLARLLRPTTRAFRSALEVKQELLGQLATVAGLARLASAEEASTRPAPQTWVAVSQLHDGGDPRERLWMEGFVERLHAPAGPFAVPAPRETLAARLMRLETDGSAAGETSFEELSKPRRPLRLVLLGEFGSGKTTILRHWLGKLLQQNGQLPASLPLSRLAGKQAEAALLELLQAEVRDRVPDIDDAWLHDRLERQRLALGLEDLDAVPAARRPFVVEWLAEFAVEHRRAPVLVTCRPAEYFNTPGIASRLVGAGFVCVELLAPESNNGGQHGPWGRRWNENPLRKSALAWLASRGVDGLARADCDGAVWRQVFTHLFATTGALEATWQAACCLAWELHRREQSQPTAQECVDSLRRRFRVSAPAQAREIGARRALERLTRSGVVDARGGFVHRFFAEFFAGRALALGLRTGRSAEDVLGLPDWDWWGPVLACCHVEPFTAALLSWLLRLADAGHGEAVLVAAQTLAARRDPPERQRLEVLQRLRECHDQELRIPLRRRLARACRDLGEPIASVC